MSKHLTSKRIGFEALSVSFTTITLVNLLTMIGAIFYFNNANHTINPKLFLIGFIGSFFDTIGIVCVTKAFTYGPAGLISALCTSTNIILTVIEAIRH
jgi:hypothetical protein